MYVSSWFNLHISATCLLQRLTLNLETICFSPCWIMMVTGKVKNNPFQLGIIQRILLTFGDYNCNKETAILFVSDTSSLLPQLFTVVANVKQAHECQEHGETQEFEDDIEYIMDGLDDSQPLPVRCLR